MNQRYSSKSRKAPLKAMSRKANLNSRYIGSAENSNNWSEFIETPQYPPPSPQASSALSNIYSQSPPVSPSMSMQEAPKTHQDIMLEINNEIHGINSSPYDKPIGKADDSRPAAARNIVHRGVLYSSRFHFSWCHCLIIMCLSTPIM